jgi:hypothetical protein
MADIADLTNHLFLWHLTPRVKADRIAIQGFLPKGQSRQAHVSRAIWFFTGPFSFVRRVQLENKRDDYDAFLVALPIASLGDSWNGQVADELTVFQPVPPDTILTRFPANRATDRAQLLHTLEESLGDDLIDRLVVLCKREDIPWSQRTSPAGLLMYLDRERYDQEHITTLAFQDSFPSLALSDCITLCRSLATIDFRFYHYFLRQYYITYGERHVARALLTAAAGRIGIDRIVTLCCGDSTETGPNLVARFVMDILPHISRKDLAFALFEVRTMRPYRVSDDVTGRLESWLLAQPESVGIAPYFIEHALDIFHARFGKLAVDLAARILAESGTDHYHTLIRIAESSHPQSRLGAVRAFGVMREERALSRLEGCLDTDWKAMREEAIGSLGRLQSARAKELVMAATNDRAGSVRRKAERILAGPTRNEAIEADNRSGDRGKTDTDHSPSPTPRSTDRSSGWASPTI